MELRRWQLTIHPTEDIFIEIKIDSFELLPTWSIPA